MMITIGLLAIILLALALMLWVRSPWGAGA